LLLDGKENEDMAYVYAFAWRAVVLWLQVRPEFDEDRSFNQRLWPDSLLDVEGI
jgi:hypothetical protein